MARRKDKQVHKVYGWEHQWYHWNNQMISLYGARMWVRWACRVYGIDPPVVRAAKPKAATSFYDPEEHAISLKPRHTNAAVALHEAAHAIQDRYYDWDKIEDHGPEFAGIYISLLLASKMYPETAITASAKAAGIKTSRGATPYAIRPKRRTKKSPR